MIKIWRQYIIPHHPLSRCMAYFVTRKTPWLKNWQIRTFIKKYSVDMSQAQFTSPENYVTFTDFFTRHLQKKARSIAKGEHTVVSPADACIAQIGNIVKNQLIQAKDHFFHVDELLGGDKLLAQTFYDGSFATFYLAPKDYHRVHMPVTGRLRTMIHIPGHLFSVNLHTAAYVPKLFARNERVVCIFDTAMGPMAVILVGAMFVASIVTTWAGTVTPCRTKNITTTSYHQHPPIVLNKGEELGFFNFGSTVIILFEKNALTWHEKYKKGDSINMGEALATQKS